MDDSCSADRASRASQTALLLRELQQMWQQGDPPRLAWLIGRLDEPTTEAKLQLIAADLNARWQRVGDASVTSATVGDLPARPLAEDYAGFFCDDDWPWVLEKLVLEEFQARHRWGDRPDFEDYRRRFPTQVADWQARIAWPYDSAWNPEQAAANDAATELPAPCSRTGSGIGPTMNPNPHQGDGREASGHHRSTDADAASGKPIPGAQVVTASTRIVLPGVPAANGPEAKFSTPGDPPLSAASASTSGASTADDQTPHQPWMPLAIGERISRYRILSVLGSGTFAVVYLAAQEDLGRLVALKVTRISTTPIRTQAWPRRLISTAPSEPHARFASEETSKLVVLEHDSIVKVYDEERIAERDLLLISMQFVWGTTLKEIIHRAAVTPWASRCGMNLLPLLSDGGPPPLGLSPAIQQQREYVASLPYKSAVFELAIQLASALNVAHAWGMLHLDIKPANILVNQAGRPLLADFNLASDMASLRSAPNIGGTLLYMAPEHLEAFNPEDPTTPEVIDERTDCYSLALVIFEVAACRYPFETRLMANQSISQAAAAAAEERRSFVPKLADYAPAMPRSLDWVLQRALSPDKQDRFESTTEFSRALTAAQKYDEITSRLPEAQWLQAVSRWPRWTMALLAIAPHFIGNVLMIVYPCLIGAAPVESARYWYTFLGLNALVYVATVWAVCRFAFPLIGQLEDVERRAPHSHQDADTARAGYSRTVVAIVTTGLAAWMVMSVETVGWLDLHILLTWLLATTIFTSYSYFGSELLVVRCFYPRLLVMNSSPTITARRELRAASNRVRRFKLLAGLAPMVGALLLMLPAEDPAQLAAIRLLIKALLVLGIVGYLTATAVGGRIQRTIDALTDRAA